MRTRDYLLENRDDMGTSGTKVYNLDFTDPISEIGLLFEATNGSGTNDNNPIERNITRIELVDGGQVLWDLPGEMALSYWSHLNQGLAHCWRDAASGGTPWQPIDIRFGRHLYDPLFAFNPMAHRNPQLRVTFDEAHIRAAGAGGYSSDTFNLSILVKLMEDAPAPVGFLANRLVDAIATVGSGESKHELPTDKDIRALMVRVYDSGVHHSTSISRYRMSCDGGKFIPFDLFSRNMRDKMGGYFKPLTIPGKTVLGTGEAIESWIGDCFTAYIRSMTSGIIIGAPGHSGGKLIFYLEDHDGSDPADVNITYAVEGLAFHNTQIYPFGRLDVPEDWFRAREYKKIDLFLTNGATTGEIEVAVQQLYRY